MIEKAKTAYPARLVVGLRDDQYALLKKARAVTGRACGDILRDAGIALARRLIADAKRLKLDE